MRRQDDNWYKERIRQSSHAEQGWAALHRGETLPDEYFEEMEWDTPSQVMREREELRMTQGEYDRYKALPKWERDQIKYQRMYASTPKKPLTRLRDPDDPSTFDESLPSEYPATPYKRQVPTYAPRSPEEDSVGCSVCTTRGARHQCGGCGKRKYCGAECQRRDWHAGGHCHKCK